MYALSIRQVNDISSDIDPLDLLPPAILNDLLDVKHPCGVGGLTPRYLILYTSDRAQFQISYPRPFSQNLFDYLTFNLQLTAFEFVIVSLLLLAPTRLLLGFLIIIPTAKDSAIANFEKYRIQQLTKKSTAVLEQVETSIEQETDKLIHLERSSHEADH